MYNAIDPGIYGQYEVENLSLSRVFIIFILDTHRFKRYRFGGSLALSPAPPRCTEEYEYRELKFC